MHHMFNLTSLLLTGSLLVVSFFSSQSRPLTINYANKYLIQQGVAADGSLYMYSPYYLWEDGIYNDSKALTKPLELRSVNGEMDITLTVQSTRLQTELFDISTRVFCFDGICNAPGPSLYCKAGDTVKITLINDLEDTSGMASRGPWSGSELFPNRTNIFIQGLPLDPAINNPYRFASGNGDSLVYEYTIPVNTGPGMHWYHSRVHGSAALHVMGGLFGAFIVEPSSSTGTELPPALEAIERQVIVLSHIMVARNEKYIPGVVGNGFSLIDQGFTNSSLTIDYLSDAYGSSLDPDTTLYTISLLSAEIDNGNSDTATTVVPDAWLVNGKFQPEFTVQPRQWRMLDILVASGDRHVELEIRTAVGVGQGTEACEMRLLALDGVYFNETRTDGGVRHLTLLQSGRASLAVMCATAGEFYFQTASTFDSSSEYAQIGDTQTKSTQILMKIIVTGTTFVMDAPPADLSSIKRPTYVGTVDPINGAFVPIITTTSSSDDSDSSGSSGSVESISLSTAQGGCCDSGDSGDTSTSTQLCEQVLLPNSYWLGLGEDCRPACYGKVLCAALSGVSEVEEVNLGNANSAGENNVYTVATFPTVRNGNCAYRSFPGFYQYNSSLSTTDTCHVALESTDADRITFTREYGSDDGGDDVDLVNAATAGASASVTADRVQEITLWGHSDYAYPIFIQGAVLQLGGFTNVDHTLSNIVSSGEYELNSNINSSLYAYPGDWKESWPALTGQSILYAKLSSSMTSRSTESSTSSGSLLVMSAFLKYEDIGAINNILVQPAPASGNTTEISGSDSMPNNSTTESAPSDSSIIPDPPISAIHDSDSAAVTYQCDVSGNSFYYTEVIDLDTRTRNITTHSCPNHFSHCQSSECGGSVKTRALKHFQSLVLPLYPMFADNSVNTQNTGPEDTTCTSDMVGIALNGVGIYGMSDGETDQCLDDTTGDYTKAVYGRTSCDRAGQFAGIKYCGNAVTSRGQEIDKCGGFADRTGGVYRYHVTPTCLQEQLVSDGKAVVDHSPQLGWALDGFPVYGPIGAKGIEMRPCGVPGAHPQLCLDACNGYYGRLPGYDSFLYRYYFTGTAASSSGSGAGVNVGTGEEQEDVYACSANVYHVPTDGQATLCDREINPCCTRAVPTTVFAPYSIGCLRGCKYQDSSSSSSLSAATCSVSGGGVKGYAADYAPQVSLFATSVNEASNVETYANTSSEVLGSDAGNTTTITTSATPEDTTNLRTVATRHAFDSAVTLTQFLSTTSNHSFPSTVVAAGGDVDDDDDGTAAGVDTSVVTQTVLPRSTHDAHITGMVVKEREGLIYYTTTMGVYVYNESTQTVQTILTGIVNVELEGYNLGAYREDLRYIKVNNQLCTSVIHISSTQLRCVMVLSDTPSLSYSASDTFSGSALGSTLTSIDETSTVAEVTASLVPFRIEQVEVATIGGKTAGISTSPMSIVRSGSGRPALTGIRLSLQPFAPSALAVVDHYEASAAATPTIGEDSSSSSSSSSDSANSADSLVAVRTLYWSNFAYGAYSIQRSFEDGSQVETVVNNVQRAVALEALPVELNQYMQYVSTLNSTSVGDDASSDSSASSSASSSTAALLASTTSCNTTSRYQAGLIYTLWNEALSQNVTFRSSYSESSSSASATACSLVGHVLLFLDAQGQSFNKMSLLPISLQEVFVPYATAARGDNDDDAGDVILTDADYYSAFHVQDQPYAVTQAVAPVKLLLGLEGARSFTLELQSSSIYLTLSRGLVLRVDADYLLSAVDFSINSDDYGGENTNNSSIATAAAVESPDALVSINVRHLLRGGRGSRLGLPSWISLQARMTTKARLQGVCALPLLADVAALDSADTSNGSSNDIANSSATSANDVPDKPVSWLQQRILVLDTNQQLLHAMSQSGFPSNTLPLGARYGVFWPHQIYCSTSESSSSTRNSSSSGDDFNNNTMIDFGTTTTTSNVMTAYISEYLGRIWKFQLVRDSMGKFQFRDAAAPTLVMDQSMFPSSIQIRTYLNYAKDQGLDAALNQVFYEISD